MLAPPDEVEPMGQLPHAEAEVAPVVLKYVPAKQLVHVLCPVLAWYWPVGQIVHAACVVMLW